MEGDKASYLVHKLKMKMILNKNKKRNKLVKIAAYF